jgi:hypothetical protein
MEKGKKKSDAAVLDDRAAVDEPWSGRFNLKSACMLLQDGF